jgi:hypothetical protein
VILDRALYRTRQFVRYSNGREADDGAAREILPPRLFALFRSMDGGGRRHHLAVYQRLRQLGVRDPDELAAALLHDVGKGRVSPVTRAIYVVATRVWRGAPQALAGPGGRWWPAMRRLWRHPELGARQVAGSGGSPRLVWLIANHQRTDLDEPALKRLQDADDHS